MYIPSLPPSRGSRYPAQTMLCYRDRAPSHPCSALPGPFPSMPITYVPNLTPRLWYVIKNVPDLPLSYMLIVHIPTGTRPLPSPDSPKPSHQFISTIIYYMLFII